MSKKIRHQWKCNPIKYLPQGYMRFQKKWGGSIKKGWKAEFTIKTLYLLKHVNQDGPHVHGDLKLNDRSTFVAHLS